MARTGNTARKSVKSCSSKMEAGRSCGTSRKGSKKNSSSQHCN